MKVRILFIAAAAAIAAAAGLAIADRAARVPAAYMAKTLCSEIFLAGRDEAVVRAVEFEGISPAIDLARAAVDRKARRASASLYGFGRATALYRDGEGCVIVKGAPTQAPPPGDPILNTSYTPWAEGFAGTPGALDRIDYASLDASLDAAMADGAAATRALLVVVDGRLVAERYGEGFGPETPFLSWSMAKSVTATLIGAAVQRGLIDIAAPVPVSEWAGDARRAALTWDDLLRMQSGLAFKEDYGDPFSDVSRMLFDAHSAGAVAARKPLIHPPETSWAYSSGTSNILARALRPALEAKGESYDAFPREALFAPLGAASAVMERDSSGHYIGSSYMYATARDWARLGQLYLDDGVWNGARLLPEGWAAYAASPTPASDGAYGAHFWLNRDGAARRRYMPNAPEDIYYFAGHEGQYVFIAPSANAVIVRTGITRGAVPLDVVAPMLTQILAAVGEATP